VVVYMGDDQADEFLYKFVSKGRLTAGMKDAGALLDEGTLYAAEFRDDDTGVWHELKPGDGLPDLAHVCVYTRDAARATPGTRMDRPEWVAVHPDTGEVYCTLTNNSGRAARAPANPRTRNVFGQIVRWREAGGDAAATSFDWDLFLLAGDPQTDTQDPPVDIRGDAFGSPDGLWFDPRGILWIQTDVSTSKVGRKQYKYLGNNMMLAADPKRKTVRRFLTGPRGCEITGVAMSPDRRALFLNIQHPGESSSGLLDHPQEISSWPDGPHGGRPRPATIVVTREDGGEIGT
jgi:secreted PhoX family phosphatase